MVVTPSPSGPRQRARLVDPSDDRQVRLLLQLDPHPAAGPPDDVRDRAPQAL